MQIPAALSKCDLDSERQEMLRDSTVDLLLSVLPQFLHCPVHQDAFMGLGADGLMMQVDSPRAVSSASMENQLARTAVSSCFTAQQSRSKASPRPFASQRCSRFHLLFLYFLIVSWLSPFGAVGPWTAGEICPKMAEWPLAMRWESCARRTNSMGVSFLDRRSGYADPGLSAEVFDR